MAEREPPFWRRYRRLFGPDPQADIEDEVRHHIELLVEHNRARGLSAAEARAAAPRLWRPFKIDANPELAASGTVTGSV